MKAQSQKVPIPLAWYVETQATPALQAFRDIIGEANFNLNSILAGLFVLEQQVKRPAVSLIVSWEPTDFKAAAAGARTLATRSILVYAVSALEQYFRALTRRPYSLEPGQLRAIVGGQFQPEPALRSMTEKAVERLRKALAASPNLEEVETTVNAFRAEYMQRSKRPSMRYRFDRLMSLCPEIPLQHKVAVHILLDWRNSHAHAAAHRQMSKLDREAWTNGYEQLSKTNPRADPAGLLARFESGEDPTPDDLGTLLALLHRTITATDVCVIAAMNLERFTYEMLAVNFKTLAQRDEQFAIWWGRTDRNRATRLQGLARSQGTVLVTRTKNSTPKASLSDDFWLALARRKRLDVLTELKNFDFSGEMDAVDAEPSDEV